MGSPRSLQLAEARSYNILSPSSVRLDRHGELTNQICRVAFTSSPPVCGHGTGGSAATDTRGVSRSRENFAQCTGGWRSLSVPFAPVLPHSLLCFAAFGHVVDMLNPPSL